MYGHRARIGYTSPPYLTETFPYEFYRMVPDGVTLVLATLAIKRLTAEETARSVEMTLEAAREMGRAGVDVVVFGGVPLNLSLGYEGLGRDHAPDRGRDRRSGHLQRHRPGERAPGGRREAARPPPPVRRAGRVRHVIRRALRVRTGAG